MFKITLTIATSVVLLMSGAADLFAMEPLEDESKVTISHMPKDVTKLILAEASKDVNPRRLVSVCKSWYNIIRKNNSPQRAELHYSTMNPFMKESMNTYWENLFYNGVLKYTPTDDGQTVSLKFSDLNEDGTFDLSACGNKDRYLVITTKMDRFFKVGEENENKVVVLITPRYLVEQRITASPTHPVAALMADGDPDKAPMNMFWRWGNDTNLTDVDYLTTASAREISSRNLYENWCDHAGVDDARQGQGHCYGPFVVHDLNTHMICARTWFFHVNF